MEFDAKGFMDHLKSQFPPMESHFTYDLVEHVVVMGLEKHSGDPEALSLFLVDAIPEITADEVAKFWKPQTDEKSN